MRNRQIEHIGTVQRIMDQSVVVSITQEAACSACAAAQLCHSADKQEKSMEIPCVDTARYAVGQSVLVVGELGLGLRATLWAYAVPLVLLMVVLIVVSRATGSEGWGAVSALFSLIPYYIILYILRDRLQRTFTFRLKSLE